ncbi:ABC transporter ATP-binding protein/permease [Eubacteriales bacterium OttesenSCG-928-G02]|nr:ABC transporter ATP-binding protein/permease [Eubacteriales bacterium OttesenSCG-928-G02]
MNIKNFRFYITEFNKYGKSYFILLMFTCFLAPVSVLIDSTILKFVFDKVQTGSSLNQIFVLIIFYCVISLLLALFATLFERYGGVKTTKIRYEMNKTIYEKAKRTDLKYFDNPDFFDKFTWAIQNYFSRSMSSVNIVARFTSSLLSVISILTIITILNPIVILFSLVNVVLTLFLNTILNKLYYKQNTELLKPDRIDSYIHRVFYLRDYSLDIKATGLSGYLLKKFKNNTSDKCEIIEKYRNKTSAIAFMSKAVPYISSFATVMFLTYQISNGNISYGDFVILFTSSQNLTSSLLEMTSILPQIFDHGMYAKNIIDFFELESEVENTFNDSEIEKAPLNIKIKNLSFRYSPEQDYILKNINMEIEKNKKIAIVGHNGAGKTTFTKLLLRCYDPEEGEILFNDINIKNYNINSLRQSITTAFQDSKVFALTLKDNINIFSDSDEEFNYKKAADFMQEMNLDKYIDFIDSDVTKEFSNDGLIFSGGEKQKISIIRTLIKDYPLIIYDEPSSSLDPEAEYELVKQIYEKTNNSTLILISHRLSVIRDFDVIYVFDSGEIIESGTHEDLINKRGQYYEMFIKQAENYVK